MGENAPLKDFLQRWLISAVAVLVATYIVPGIHYERVLDLFMATFILGLLNTFVRPLLLLLSLPLVVVTLGLFNLVISALLLKLVGELLEPRFSVATFGTAFWGGVVIGLVSLALHALTGTSRVSVRMRRGAPPKPKRKGPDDFDGPVIDV